MLVRRIALAMVGVTLLVALILMSADCDDGSNIINDAITVDLFGLLRPMVN